MNIEIFNEPFRVTLFGFSGAIIDGNVPDCGKRLMDMMWKEVQSFRIANKGINHWVYLPDSVIFTGIEVATNGSAVGTLEKLDVILEQYAKHTHIGPYATLPQVWPKLLEELKQRNEEPRLPNLEIYGHWNSDPARCETTILIGLRQQCG